MGGEQYLKTYKNISTIMCVYTCMYLVTDYEVHCLKSGSTVCIAKSTKTDCFP